MMLTQILKQECQICKKVALEESRFKFGKTTIIKLVCGHSIYQESLGSSQKELESIIFNDNCKPRPYQLDAVRFLEDSNGRCIIADEQGLGKTIEALSFLRLHQKKLLPAIIVCPSTVKLQWMYEIHRICCDSRAAKDLSFLTQIIQTGKEKALPGFKLYIITYDILKNENIFSFLPDGFIKTIIIDECQRIKNHLSDRAKAVQRFVKNQGIEHIISMSGTPIKNNAGEYFTVLNLVKPTLFPQWQRYIDNYCDSYNNGWGTKVGGIKDLERFKEDTKDIIIRRTKSEVLKDLPSKERKFRHVELDRKLHGIYGKLMDELDDMMYGEDDFQTMSNKIAIMSKMRHITGISKVDACVDFVIEFLLSTDRKICIFVHHKDVAEMLQVKLNEWMKDGNFHDVFKLHSGLSGDERQKLIARFRNEDEVRVMILSTLAASEGINLQFCSDAVLLERQWNPANEEQAEDRFHRFGQENPVSITYMIASGTIDDFFTELVEVKRARISATLDGKEINWDQQSLMKELSEILITRGKKAWSL